MSKIPGFRSGKAWKKLLATVGYVFIALVVYGAINGKNDSSTPTSTLKTNSVSVQTKTPEQITKEKSNADKMNSDILYYSQVKAKEIFKDKLVSVEKDDKGILITFKLSDNLSMKMVGDGGFIDSSKMFALYKGHKGNYTDITCLGTYPMQDKYGNVSDKVIFAITLDNDTIQKTTFENIYPSKDLIPLSSSHAIRPELLAE